MNKALGKHYAAKAVAIEKRWDTTSVGVCLVGENSNGLLRLHKAAVRVYGPNTEEGLANIDCVAEWVAAKLDAGTYHGPWKLDVTSKKGVMILRLAKS